MFGVLEKVHNNQGTLIEFVPDNNAFISFVEKIFDKQFSCAKDNEYYEIIYGDATYNDKIVIKYTVTELVIGYLYNSRSTSEIYTTYELVPINFSALSRFILASSKTTTKTDTNTIINSYISKHFKHLNHPFDDYDLSDIKSDIKVENNTENNTVNVSDVNSDNLSNAKLSEMNVNNNDGMLIKVDRKRTFVNKFNSDNMEKYPQICIVCNDVEKREDLVKSLTDTIVKNTNIKEMIIFATKKTVHFYKEQYPYADIFLKYDDIILEKLLDRAKNNFLNTKVKYNTCVIFDSFYPDINARFNELKCLADLLLNGRHYGISVIYAMSKPASISPEFRHNFDYVLLGAEHRRKRIRKTHDYYASMLPTYYYLQTLIDIITDDNYSDSRFLMILNKNSSYNIDDRIAYYSTKKSVRIY